MIRDKEDARSSAATLGRAVENGPSSQTAHASTAEFTTPRAERQQFRIADFLHLGAQGAILQRRSQRQRQKLSEQGASD